MRGEGIKSATSPGKPAPICRDCLHRYAHLRGDQVADLKPAAKLVELRMQCANKVKE